MDKKEVQYRKNETDLHVMGEELLKDCHEETLFDIEEVLLQRAHTVRNAAIVMTYQGMKVLGNLFSTSVQQAIKKELRSVIDTSLEEKLTSMLNGQTMGLLQFATQLGLPIDLSETTINTLTNHPDSMSTTSPSQQEQSTNHSTTTIESTTNDKTNPTLAKTQTQFIEETLKEETPSSTSNEKPQTNTSEPITMKLVDERPFTSPYRSHVTAERRREAEFVAKILRDLNEPVRLRDLVELTKGDVHWSHNPTGKITSLIGANSHIKRSRLGYYQYHEENE